MMLDLVILCLICREVLEASFISVEGKKDELLIKPHECPDDKTSEEDGPDDNIWSEK